MKQAVLYALCFLASSLLAAHCSTDLTGIRAAGNRLVNYQNEPVHLRGLNHAGSEYACVQGWGIFEKPYNQSLVDGFKAWKANAVRVTMNEDCWLGINGVKSQYSGQNYINALESYVNMFTSQGFVVLLDLHWTAPGSQPATKQLPMPDRDHTIDFWKSVAQKFSGNDKVIFELFNEPFPDSGNWDSENGWKCWRDGGSSCNGLNYQAAGMQELVSAIRGVGAKNLLILGGLAWSNSLAQWMKYAPNDTENNIGAVWHSYNFNHCNNENCWNQYIKPVADKYPVIATEFGENDCAGGYVTSVMKWLDANAGGNYLAWTFNTWDCKGGPALISSYDNNGTPNTYGSAVKQHYASFN